MHIHLSWALGVVLAALACLPGCCCPMTCAPTCCSSPGWLEQLEDGYYCAAEEMQAGACRLKHQLNSQLSRLSSGMRCSQCDAGRFSSNQDQSCQCDHDQGDRCLCEDGTNAMEQTGVHQRTAQQQRQTARDQATAQIQPFTASDSTTCQNPNCEKHGKLKSRRRIEGPRQIREPPPPGANAGRCKRCKVKPCRCGYCEGCDQPDSLESGMSYQLRAGGGTCAAPAETLDAQDFQALPTPPDVSPPPAPLDPGPGPTPIRPPPPDNIKTPTSKGAAGIQPQSATSDVSVSLEDGPSLEQISFRKVGAKKTDNWMPVPGSKVSR